MRMLTADLWTIRKKRTIKTEIAYGSLLLHRVYEWVSECVAYGHFYDSIITMHSIKFSKKKRNQ